MKIRKGDEVLVVTGKDRGEKGKVRQSLPREKRVVVEGVNMVKRHTKPRGRSMKGGIVQREAPFHVSNVMLICPKCNRPTHVGFQLRGDGTKVRMCKKCGEAID